MVTLFEYLHLSDYHVQLLGTPKASSLLLQNSGYATTKQIWDNYDQDIDKLSKAIECKNKQV